MGSDIAASIVHLKKKYKTKDLYEILQKRYPDHFKKNYDYGGHGGTRTQYTNVISDHGIRNEYRCNL